MTSSTVRWGILGCGNIAHKFAAGLQAVDHATCYAAASRSIERAASFAERHRFERAYGSYRELVEDPDLDIVYIATPHTYHYAHARLCLEHGKAVLCEKPFTMNRGQLDHLVSLARERGLFMMEALWSRFLPGILRVKELLEDGLLGRIVGMDADFGIRAPYDPKSRLYDPYLGGGALLDIGIYPIFLSLFLFGPPQSYTALSSLNGNRNDLSTSAIFQYRDGLLTNLRSTILADTLVEATLFGERGTLTVNRLWFTPTPVTVQLTGSKKEILKFPPLVNGYEYEAMEATQCMRSGQTESSVMPHAFSLELMELLDGIRRETGIMYPPEVESIEHPYGSA